MEPINKCIKFTNQTEIPQAEQSRETDKFGNFVKIIYSDIWTFEKSVMEITFNNGSFFKKENMIVKDETGIEQTIEIDTYFNASFYPVCARVSEKQLENQ